MHRFWQKWNLRNFSNLLFFERHYLQWQINPNIMKRYLVRSLSKTKAWHLHLPHTDKFLETESGNLALIYITAAVKLTSLWLLFLSFWKVRVYIVVVQKKYFNHCFGCCSYPSVVLSSFMFAFHALGIFKSLCDTNFYIVIMYYLIQKKYKC